jgi:SAM-dependent methyltransferase
MERTGGAYSLLSRPRVYSGVQRLLGGSSVWPRIVADHLRPRPGDRVLDLGCGTGELVEHLPAVDYVGVELNPSYVDAARERYGDRGTFHALDVRDADFPEGSFDIVSVMALLHHLDDEGVASVLRVAATALADSGRMVALDAVFTDDQSRLARWMIGMDRGANVRGLEAYAALARPFFGRVEAVVREDLMRIPYTHVILECEQPRRSGKAGDEQQRAARRQ